MGQKIHPTGFRLAVTRDWSSRWYANSKNFAGMLNEDVQVRDFLKKKLKHASVGRVLIERPAKNARVTVFQRCLRASLASSNAAACEPARQPPGFRLSLRAARYDQGFPP